MKRRSFLKVVGGVTGGVVAGVQPNLQAAAEAVTSIVDGMPRRVLGRTGAKISVIGFPGLALSNYDQERGTKDVHQAFERGVNYFDVAPAYGRDGDCEKKMGVALQGLDRSRYFLSCKTKKRDKDGAREELERSLQRLKTDHFDLYQLHHLVKPAEVQQALGPGGAMETILKAKEQGKVKYIGFSAHTTKGALEALRGFSFDTVMFPINFVELFNGGFGREVLDLAREKGAAVIAIKPLSWGAWAQGSKRNRQWWYRCLETQDEVNLGWNWTLSQPGVVTGIPPSWLDLVDKAIEASRAFRQLTEADSLKLREMAANCGSIFKREEDSVALGTTYHSPYPHHPHEPEGQMWA